MEGRGPLLNHRFVMGFEPVEMHNEQGRNPTVKERKKKATERLRKMTTRERCLIMERAIYVEELQEVPVVYQDM
ncbi:unnamed protein product [Malus baccata var. baccata]